MPTLTANNQVDTRRLAWGRTTIWKRPCICPMVSSRSRRSVPASISTLGPLNPRNAVLRPSYQPRLHMYLRCSITAEQPCSLTWNC